LRNDKEMIALDVRAPAAPAAPALTAKGTAAQGTRDREDAR
jgi:hypothetical protein